MGMKLDGLANFGKALVALQADIPEIMDKLVVGEGRFARDQARKICTEENIINTGDFMGKKVQKEDTLGILESVVEGRAEFKPWGPFSDIEIMEWDGFVPDLTDKGYVTQMQARMQDRLNYVEGLKDAEGGFNALPDDAADAIRKVVEQANSL